MWKRMMIVGFAAVMGFGPVMAMGQTSRPGLNGGAGRGGLNPLSLGYILDIEGTTASDQRELNLDFGLVLGSSIQYDSTQGPVRIFHRKIPPFENGHFSAFCEFFNSNSQRVDLSVDDVQALAKKVDARLSAIIKNKPSMPAEQQLARLNEISATLEDLNQKRYMLSQLFGGASPPHSSDFANQLRQTLRDQIEQLGSQIVAKDARQSALESAITDQKAIGQKKLADDPVTADLKKVVELNEQNAADVKAKWERGLVVLTDVSAANVAVAEARVRLAEREEEVSATGKGQLLDRLSDELAEIAVDAAELKARMAYCRHELELLNGPKDASQLDELIKTTEELTRQPDSAAMNNDLTSQIDKLAAERFALEVSDVTVTVVPAP